MKILLTFFLVLFSMLLFSQDLRITEFRVRKYDPDSLVRVIQHTKGKEKIDALNYLSSVLFLADTDSSMHCALKAIKLAKQMKYKKGVADGYQFLGNAYYIQDSLAPTLRCYLKALRIYEDLEPTEDYGHLVKQLSILNGRYNRYEQAMPYTRKALEIWTKLKDTANIRRATMGLGTCYFFIKDQDSTGAYTDSSFYYFKKALKMHEKNPNNFELPHIYNELGRLNGYLFDKSNDTSYITRAIPWFKKGLSIPDLEKSWIHMLTYNLGFFYRTYSSPDSVAIGDAYFKKFYSMTDTNTWIYWRDGWDCFDNGMIDSALYLFKKAQVKNKEAIEEFSRVKSGNPIYYVGARDKFYKWKAEIHEGLYECYKAMGNSKLALENFELMKELEDQLREKETNGLFELLEMESKEEKRKSQIIIMGQESELKESKLDQARMTNYGLIAFVVILGLFGMLLIRQNRIKNEHQTVLLEQKLLRLQMNPHFIFNALSNILNFVEQKDNKSASGYLTTFSKLLRSTLESTREDMVPFEKEVGSLKNYLELQKLRYGDQFNFQVSVDEKIDEEDMTIPPMLVQPFIENAIEHGIRHKKSPGRIDVRFVLRDNKIQCEVEDDGVGRRKAWEMEAGERSGHKSLATEIIRDRIQNLNRKLKQKIQLEIIDKISDNSEATGTKVLLDLPYRSAFD